MWAIVVCFLVILMGQSVAMFYNFQISVLLDLMIEPRLLK